MGVRGGHNGNAFNHNAPSYRLDPHGLKTLTYDFAKPVDCPPCPCKDKKNDCKLKIKWLQSGDKYAWVNYPGNPVNGSTEIPTLSKTSNSKKMKLFSEGVAAVIEVESVTSDVRNCHLAQDTRRRYKYVGKDKVEEKFKVPDIRGTKTDPSYGGWWFFDQPWHQEPDVEWVHWVGVVWIEENPTIRRLWGWAAKADYTKKGTGPDGEQKDGEGLADKRFYPDTDGLLLETVPSCPYETETAP